MPTEVTDPDILAQFEGYKKVVTDPKILSAFESDDGGKPAFDEPQELKSEEPITSAQHLARTVTDIPSEIYQAGKSAVSAMNEAFNPYSETAQAEMQRRKNLGLFEGLGETVKSGLNIGSGVLGPVNLALSPITGASRSVIGHALSAAPGGGTYEESKDKADIAMMGLRPIGGFHGSPTPLPPKPTGPLGVTLSEGQATRELPLIQREQAAGRGQLGNRAQKRAQEFIDQQTQELAQARENVTRELDPGGQILAESPQEAGDLVSKGIRQAHDTKKTEVDLAYEAARALPGEVHAGAFEGMPQHIKGDLTLAKDPVVIDDRMTPAASAMIDYLDKQIGRLGIQNKADPFGPPSPERITGVSLNGIDRWRRNLSAIRRGAATREDGRAARAVLNEFDSRVDEAINNGLFTGDPNAITAWNSARKAHVDFRSEFRAGQRDPIGRKVESILGDYNNPAAIPNDVADFLYSAPGVNPSSLNVGVATRVKSILGEQSPEWAAAKQGLFTRLVSPGEGMTDFGPGKIAQRVNRFLNVDGKELSNTVYSATERALIQHYADLMRQIEVPQAGANWSNTATFTSKSLKRIGGTLGMIVGAAIGSRMGLPFGVGEIAGAGVAKGVGKLGELSDLRAVARQMPLTTQAVRQWQRAADRAQRYNTAPSQRALEFATANLVRALAALGVDISEEEPTRQPTTQSDQYRITSPPTPLIAR
jgi:hypothetical protein